MAKWFTPCQTPKSRRHSANGFWNQCFVRTLYSQGFLREVFGCLQPCYCYSNSLKPQPQRQPTVASIHELLLCTRLLLSSSSSSLRRVESSAFVFLERIQNPLHPVQRNVRLRWMTSASSHLSTDNALALLNVCPSKLHRHSRLCRKKPKSCGKKSLIPVGGELSSAEIDWPDIRCVGP